MEYPSSNLAHCHTQCHILHQSSKSIFSTSECLIQTVCKWVGGVCGTFGMGDTRYIPLHKKLGACMLGSVLASSVAWFWFWSGITCDFYTIGSPLSSAIFFNLGYHGDRRYAQLSSKANSLC